MKKLPVGKQNIRDILSNNLLYVDKTRQIYELIQQGSLYFLSRPRRFGKSLTISVLKEIFSGNRALFQGLHIAEKADYDWQSYPILHFSFNDFGHQATELERLFNEAISKYAKAFDVEVDAVNLIGQFKNLVESVAEKTGKSVVILIDEYDKPIVDFLTEHEQAKKNQKVLREFFSPLKGLESRGLLRFLFITGVSKFSKVSLFSDLNNLTDLTISPLAKDLVGITHEELLENFSDRIQAAGESLKMSKEFLLEGVQLWYNGYSFDGTVSLYNPFSLLSFFQQYRFRNFWFATGTPTFLVEMARHKRLEPQELEHKKVAESFFNTYSLEHLDLIGLLYQTGYLTIKDTSPNRYDVDYILGYPNQEVRKSFVHNLLEAYTFQTDSTVSSALLNMKDGLRTGDLDLFFKNLNILFADLSYFHHPKAREKAEAEAKLFAMWEGYFHSIIYLVTVFLGLEVQSEIAKHQGRLDLVAETEDYLYLMEFKLEQPIENAIQQIKERDYAASYQNTAKNLILVGVNFSKATRSIEAWESEVWER
ncbi:MAG: AAA family ATPase [Bacteroidota bacterium]